MSSTLLDRKMVYWEHQLLDLGKRNKMINYRETKRSTLKLIEPSFDELFQRLAVNEETLTFQRAVDRETDLRVFSILSLLENLSSPLPVTIGDIKTEGNIIDRQKNLKTIRSKARLSLEEQGINILYLSFGFIEWRDGKSASSQWIKSPLILVPAVLALEALNSPFTLSKHEDDVVVNPTLEYYFKTEFGIELPHFDMDSDTLDDYFMRLEEISDQRGWRIIKEVSLGLLSFQKITMYNDLLRNEERIKRNPVIRAMSGDVDDANYIPDDIRSFDLDTIRTQDCYQVMSADSSQQDAILYSKNNISFVMQGPPGTGKSQTITNIIAEALAQGKKVLFVSEKMAALQVVYRRLQDAHLADFCLPLHSNKANKKAILEQIGANLSLNQRHVNDSALNALEDLLEIRQELNQYATELHKLNPNLFISCYEAYSRLEEVNDAPSVVFTLDDPLSVSQARLQSFLNKLKDYSLSIQRMGYHVQDNPWNGLSSRTAGYEYSEKMQREMGILYEKLTSIQSILDAVKECPELGEVLTFADIPALKEALTMIAELPLVPSCWLGEIDLQHFVSDAERMKTQYDRLFSLENEIGQVFHTEIFNCDYNGWKQELAIRANSLIGMPFVQSDSADYLINNAFTLQELFASIQSALSQAAESFQSINELIGTSLVPSPYHQQNLAELLKLLQGNEIVLAEWFDADLFKLKSVVSEAKEKAERLLEHERSILSNWEAEILTFDYSPIWMRYKTEYSGVFKVFNPQYRSDKKQLKALSKGIVKRLPDKVAIELLMALKSYHEQEAWFETKKEELHDAVGFYFEGVRSNWSTALSAIEAVRKIRNLPTIYTSSKLVELLTSNHKDTAALFETLLNTSTAAFTQAREAACLGTVDIDFDSPDFNGADLLPTIEFYKNKFGYIVEQKALLEPYLIQEDTKIDAIYRAIESLNTHSELSLTLTQMSGDAISQFDFLYSERSTDWDVLIGLLQKTNEIKKMPMYAGLKQIVNADAVRKQEIKRLCEAVLEIHVSAHSTFDWIRTQFAPEATGGSNSIGSLRRKLSDCLEDMSMLGHWIDYQEEKDTCCDCGLAEFIQKIEASEFYTDVDRIFLKSFYHMWLEAVCDEAASVRRFRRNTQDERIQKFIDLDDRQLAIAQMRIREKLIQDLPSSHKLLKATDEVAILNKELSKKRNIMPLRKLFRLIPNLLMKLKPCLMMSPLSVSYFLETEAYHFDLVIFDEASQIFPEDAIGAIFRGAQVVIAGDSKQLPPTNFFSATTNNADGDYDISEEDDFEEIVSDSILEEAASVLPNRTLLWHYRSKHESLIAFSNREIYHNNLITFPNSATNTPYMGVEYIYVENGYYEGGGKNHNIREAQKCVMLVLEHIQKYPDRSLGIIAFSEKQQAAIENAIIDFRERMPKYEWFFNESKDEPFFVKNLENVQGDERDTIIFSICYAKDRNGKMHMRFGPLGHAGGERRLNVAITRAKCNVRLVGSILPSDIDLNRTNSEGVRMLRRYIEFARKGTDALRPIEKDTTFELADDFCKVVARFLRKNGYKIRTQVGCSDYKIDIAIVNPRDEGEYIAGIECDGISYVHAKTARDRDHLRKTILQNMGWNLYRIWSTEWIRNPEAEGEALLSFVRSLVDQDGNVSHTVKNSNEEASDDDIVEEIASETEKPTEDISDDNPYGFAYYEEANWWDAPNTDSYDTFTRVGERILYIVSVEQPMHMDLLYKRMGPSFTAGKATESVKATIRTVITSRLDRQVEVDKDHFVRLVPEAPIAVRIPKRYATPRPMEYIHTQEAAAAMIAIIEHSFGITTEDLATECARVFGFERKGPRIKQKTDAAVNYLVENGKIKIIDGKAQILAKL